jgi:hypothetical protein
MTIKNMQTFWLLISFEQCHYNTLQKKVHIQTKCLRIEFCILNIPKEFDIHMSVHCNIITNYSQQDATYLEFIYFYRRSTGFRRFLRPSSGAHNCTYSFRYCQPILLLAATVDKMELVSSYPWQQLATVLVDNT